MDVKRPLSTYTYIIKGVKWVDAFYKRNTKGVELLCPYLVFCLREIKVIQRCESTTERMGKWVC